MQGTDNIMINNKEKLNEPMPKNDGKENKEEIFNVDSNKVEKPSEELKKLFLDEIFYQKYSDKNYEIPVNLFNIIIVPDD